ncbi:unnamed protein product, partial [marine sediment metagenome]
VKVFYKKTRGEDPFIGWHTVTPEPYPTIFTIIIR